VLSKTEYQLYESFVYDFVDVHKKRMDADGALGADERARLIEALNSLENSIKSLKTRTGKYNI
jgi:hypothetical protein